MFFVSDKFKDRDLNYLMHDFYHLVPFSQQSAFLNTIHLGPRVEHAWKIIGYTRNKRKNRKNSSSQLNRALAGWIKTSGGTSTGTREYFRGGSLIAAVFRRVEAGWVKFLANPRSCNAPIVSLLHPPTVDEIIPPLGRKNEREKRIRGGQFPRSNLEDNIYARKIAWPPHPLALRIPTKSRESLSSLVD